MKISTLYLLILSLFCFTSCMKKMEPRDTESPDKPKVVKYEDLKINSLTINPEQNDRVFGVVYFNQAGTSNSYTAEIRNYKTDCSGLIASFDAVAAKVTVGEAVQESGVTANDFTKAVTYRLYADDGQYKEFTATLTNSDYTGYPVVGITTENAKGITSRDVWVKGRMVVDRQQGVCEELVMAAEFKGRGHNSWSKAKKPYAIKLSTKNSVVGLPKHKRWVLLANASDRTLLRNRVAFEIGRRTGLAWTPDGRLVDVVLNGKFLGSYLLCEHIRVDKNRVDIPEMTADDNAGEALTGGYLLEVDRYYDEVNKFRTQYRDLPVNISSPDEEVLTAAQKKYISDYLNEVEKRIYGGAAIDPTYAELIDIDSFVDFWIVVELCHNRDTRLPGSCYMYKDRGGKLFAGPIWDFDLTSFISSSSFLLKDYEVTDMSKPDGDRSLWYKRLFTDPVFRARVKERWQSYKPALETIPAYIDAEADKLEVSADSNWRIWTLTAGQNHDETMSWRESLEAMKTNYSNRLKWMDGEIAKL